MCKKWFIPILSLRAHVILNLRQCILNIWTHRICQWRKYNRLFHCLIYIIRIKMTVGDEVPVGTDSWLPRHVSQDMSHTNIYSRGSYDNFGLLSQQNSKKTQLYLWVYPYQSSHIAGCSTWFQKVCPYKNQCLHSLIH